MRLKIRDLFFTLVFYLLAFVVGMLVYIYLPFESPLLKLFIALFAATLIIYIISLILKYDSLIGPMWGIFPIVASIVFVLDGNHYSVYAITFAALACLGGIRYLFFYIYRFVSFRCEDFRMKLLKEKKLGTFLVFLVYLLLPLIEFTAFIPGFYFINFVATAEEFAPSFMTIVALLLMLACIVFEFIADFQLSMFKRVPANDGLVYDRGLWKISRHPNYFFEICYWFSIFLVSFSMPKLIPVLVFCPLAIFVIIEMFSVKAMDAKESVKPAFKEYYDKTNPILPIFPPKALNEVENKMQEVKEEKTRKKEKKAKEKKANKKK